jgi:hypothetical protein
MTPTPNFFAVAVEMTPANLQIDSLTPEKISGDNPQDPTLQISKKESKLR